MVVILAAMAIAGLVAGALKGASDSKAAKRLLKRIAGLTGQSQAALLKGITPFFTDEQGNSTLTKLLNANTNTTFAFAKKDLGRQLVRAGLRDTGAGFFQNTGLELLRGEAFGRNKQAGFDANLKARTLQANNLMGSANLLAGVPEPQPNAIAIQGLTGFAGGLEAGAISDKGQLDGIFKNLRQNRAIRRNFGENATSNTVSNAVFQSTS